MPSATRKGRHHVHLPCSPEKACDGTIQRHHQTSRVFIKEQRIIETGYSVPPPRELAFQGVTSCFLRKMSSAMPLHKQQLPFPYLVVGEIISYIFRSGYKWYNNIGAFLDGKGGKKLLVGNRDLFYYQMKRLEALSSAHLSLICEWCFLLCFCTKSLLLQSIS